MSRNVRASTTPSTLAYATNCRHCDSPIYLAICRDGKWRSFETATIPAAEHGVWAWRRRYGMEEQELVPGKGLHFCAEYNRADFMGWTP